MKSFSKSDLQAKDTSARTPWAGTYQRWDEKTRSWVTYKVVG